jgi:type III secretion protein T
MNEVPSIIDITAWLNPLQSIMAGLPRFLAAFIVMPLLTAAIIPRFVRAGFIVVLVIVAHPSVPINGFSADYHIWSWFAFILKELFIGSMIGYGTGIIAWAFMTMGELLDDQTGFNNAQIFDPFGGYSQGPIAVLLGQIGGMLFLGFGGLHVFIQLLYESILLWPPGSLTPNVGAVLTNFSIDISASILETAARLAAPVIGALLIVELGIGLINRVASQLNTFYFSLSIKAIVGLLMLVLFLSHLADIVRQHVTGLSQLLPGLNQIWLHQ